ncbi:Branched-chain-amino-acid transaminase 1 [uncultured delta proteobacterium]|uniref:branched-chain-amino-acid transaminase n=1 Tax=uncultured delta proteobacterium TaxID=34034 RepID=A0A212J8X0_9DELT|nr:Branched-chain-amino-acid transaminase 1 [uncultured delta proteobacterium]
MNIKYELIDESKRGFLKSEDNLPFGAMRTDHMFVADYENGEWKNPRVTQYGPFSVMPGAVVLHYGQAIFEGAKAFLHPDKEIYLFRIDENIKRLNHSADILCMPHMPLEMHREGLMRLIDVERKWCPSVPESSLYVRPFMFGTQDTLGVKSSNKYTFCIILSPSGPYYAGGFSKPVKLLITQKFHRAVSGGTGTAKCGGNYASSLRAAEYAHSHGAGQVLYLDASNEFIEEVGTMNHYHVLKDGTFIIPEFNDSILRSVTSISVLELAKKGIIKARTEHIRVDDFLNKVKSGEIIEAGGFGTAAVVSPVGSYLLESGEEITVGDGQIGKHSRALYEMYSSMQIGKSPAPEGWLTQVPRYGK